MNKLGYACINLSLGKNITSNRGMNRKTFLSKGIGYASELGLLNSSDLITIMKWNIENNISFYRITSSLFPWMSEYALENLPDYQQISENLYEFGALARENGIKIEFHPGQFVVLSSPNGSVVKNALDDIEKHSQILDIMGFTPSFDNNINIHIGGAYGDKLSAAKTWIENWKKLSTGARSRLVIENDDKKNMFSVRELYDLFYTEIGIPITFDHFHHLHCEGGLDLHDAAALAGSTWGNYIPVQHYSSSRKNHEDSLAKPQAHADWIYEKIDTYIDNAWVMCESKMKDLSIIKYTREFL